MTILIGHDFCTNWEFDLKTEILLKMKKKRFYEFIGI